MRGGEGSGALKVDGADWRESEGGINGTHAHTQFVNWEVSHLLKQKTRLIGSGWTKFVQRRALLSWSLGLDFEQAYRRRGVRVGVFGSSAYHVF